MGRDARQRKEMAIDEDCARKTDERRGRRSERKAPRGSCRRRIDSSIAEREFPGANSLVSARFSRQTRNRRYDQPTRQQQLHGQQERCSSWQSSQPKAR